MWRGDERFPPAALIVPTERDGDGGLERPSLTLTATFISHLLVKVWVDPATEEILPAESLPVDFQTCIVAAKP